MLAGESGPGDTGCEFAGRIGGGRQGQGEEQEQEEGEGGQAGPEQRGLVTVVTDAQTGANLEWEGVVTVVKATRTCYSS